MKILALFAAVALAGFAGLSALRPAPRSGPEPLRYGADACSRCRMLLSEPGFAGEMRSARGELTRYDDVGCLLRALRESRTETPEAWVEDHQTRALVPLLKAALVAGKRVRTPMGHGIVAFADQAQARAFAEEHGARIIPLEELLRHPDQLASTASPSEGRATR